MISLYFHIPFCIHRCAYCDFNTYAGQEPLIPAYVEALCREIKIVAFSAPERLSAHTIFFGGGTPSLLSADQFESILKTVQDSFNLTPDVEISLEANPGTLTLDFLRDLRTLGFNRISLGVQSVHADELHQLERIHDTFDVIEAVTWARRAGFDNLNLDLIFGLPEQPLDRWQATVNFILGLHPEHLSLYALTVEHGTPFGRWAQRGLLSMPDPDTAADMYEWAGEALEAARTALADIALYPDGAGFELKAALARKHDVAANCITMGNGSNDVLDLVARVFLAPGSEAVTEMVGKSTLGRSLTGRRR